MISIGLRPGIAPRSVESPGLAAAGNYSKDSQAATKKGHGSAASISTGTGASASTGANHAPTLSATEPSKGISVGRIPPLPATRVQPDPPGKAPAAPHSVASRGAEKAAAPVYDPSDCHEQTPLIDPRLVTHVLIPRSDASFFEVAGKVCRVNNPSFKDYAPGEPVGGYEYVAKIAKCKGMGEFPLYAALVMVLDNGHGAGEKGVDASAYSEHIKARVVDGLQSASYDSPAWKDCLRKLIQTEKQLRFLFVVTESKVYAVGRRESARDSHLGQHCFDVDGRALGMKPWAAGMSDRHPLALEGDYAIYSAVASAPYPTLLYITSSNVKEQLTRRIHKERVQASLIQNFERGFSRLGRGITGLLLAGELISACVDISKQDKNESFVALMLDLDAIAAKVRELRTRAASALSKQMMAQSSHGVDRACGEDFKPEECGSAHDKEYADSDVGSDWVWPDSDLLGSDAWEIVSNVGDSSSSPVSSMVGEQEFEWLEHPQGTQDERVDKLFAYLNEQRSRHSDSESDRDSKHAHPRNTGGADSPRSS